MLRQENQALREESLQAQNRVKDVEFENQQLRLQASKIGQLYQRIDSL